MALIIRTLEWQVELVSLLRGGPRSFQSRIARMGSALNRQPGGHHYGSNFM